MSDSGASSLFDSQLPPAGGGRQNTGLPVTPMFCPADVDDPMDSIEWELRTASIKGDNGKELFNQENCEVPEPWSQLATNVVVSKYFYGEHGDASRENSIRQLVHRVARTITDWGRKDGYFGSDEDAETYYRDLTWLCLHQYGSFNSPVWFNVGLYPAYGVTGAACNWRWDSKAHKSVQPENPYEHPQASACFIQNVQDNMEDIMRLATSEAMLFKFGSGTGTDLSTIRSHRETLAGGGKPSGPLSFMRVYDQIAAVVKSGGKTRRAAKMQSIKVWHADILEFIECKWKEEKKAHVLIQKGGYEANFNGEAYSSILFQNANLSVRLTDEFMNAVDKGQTWNTRWVTDSNKEGPTYDAQWLLGRMADCAWHCGDPGVQYDTTINRWHTCPNSGRINASNPCSEYMFVDNSACNLASLNLMKFRNADGTFNVERYKGACRIFLIAQDILVDRASYPTGEIAENSHLFRPLGLGYSNLGCFIMASGLPYDSDEARNLCASITALMHGTANLTSTEMAAAVGCFEGYTPNREPMLNVMQMHRDEADKISTETADYLRDAAIQTWDTVLRQGSQFGFRNAQVTVLAPTGTISFMMDCDTTGIEPDIALVKNKQLAGGGSLRIINQTVPLALWTLGYEAGQIDSIIRYVDEYGMIEGAPDLKEEDLPVFDCAFKAPGGSRSIEWRGHVRMMAAAQPFLSGAISKTVNMPTNVSANDIADAYKWGWELGLKAMAVYRDGSKQSQPLSSGNDEEKSKEKSADSPKLPVKMAARPPRERLPDTRESVTHKFKVAGHEGYITVGCYPDGRPGELFITMAKEGSTVGGLMDCFGTAVSMSLQYGVPLEVLVNKFSHTRFDPMGHTPNREIRFAKSVVDYIFRWLALRFIPGYREATVGAPPEADTPTPVEQLTEKPALPTPSAPEPAVEKNRLSSPPVPPVTNGSKPTNGSSSTPNGTSKKKSPTSVLHSSGAKPEASIEDMKQDGSLSSEFARFQSDAPPCDNCGTITVRNGNCYLCYVCGNSMGCS